MVRHIGPVLAKFSTVAPEVPAVPEEIPKPLVGLKRGQKITAKVLQFGPLGASVEINEGAATGLILQDELRLFAQKRAEKVKIRDELTAFVQKVREDGKIDVSLRPLDLSRIAEVKTAVMEALQSSSSGRIPVGDKSSPDQIAELFPGMSKSDFKNAVGALYRDGLIHPSQLYVKLIPPEALPAAQEAAAKINEARRLERIEEARKERELSGAATEYVRNEDASIFIGNLPPTIDPKTFVNAVEEVILPTNIARIRLCMDIEGKPRGFGYVELLHEGLVEQAISILKGREVMGRKLRVDFADRDRRFKLAAQAERIAQYGSNDEYYRSLAKSQTTLGGRERRKELESGEDSNSNGWVKRFGENGGALSVRNNRNRDTDEHSGGYNSNVGRLTGSQRSGKGWDPTRPPFDATLYIGNLAYEVDEHQLRRQVEKIIPANEIASVRVMYDRETMRSKGFGYVDIYSSDAAEKVGEISNFIYCRFNMPFFVD